MKRVIPVLVLLVCGGCRQDLGSGEESYRDRRNPLRMTVPEEFRADSHRLMDMYMAADLSVSVDLADLDSPQVRPPRGCPVVPGLAMTSQVSVVRTSGYLPVAFGAVVVLLKTSDGDPVSSDVVESKLRKIGTDLRDLGATQVQFFCMIEGGWAAPMSLEHTDEVDTLTGKDPTKDSTVPSEGAPSDVQ